MASHGGVSPAPAKSTGSNRGSGKSSKRMELDFGALAAAHDDLDAEFDIDDDGDDEATTVKAAARPAPAPAPQPTGSAGVSPLRALVSTAGDAVTPATAPAARVVDPLRRGGIAAGSASEQAPPRGESETQADRRPQTEVLSTQLLETELVPSQAPGAETQLPSPPAPEPQQAPDEQMQEAQEPETLTAMQSAGDAGLPSRPEAQGVDVSAEPVSMQLDAEEPTPEDDVAAPSAHIPSPLREIAPGAAARGAAPAAEADQEEPLRSLVAPSAGGTASPAARAALLRPVETATAAGAQLLRQLEQLGAPAPPAALPEQRPASGLAQRAARPDGRVEPAADGRAEPAVQGGAEPPQLSLEQMAAELKKLHSRARNQQIRTQMVMNEILMLSSPLLQHQVAEVHKKVEAEDQALAALGQELMPQ